LVGHARRLGRSLALPPLPPTAIFPIPSSSDEEAYLSNLNPGALKG
jgi:hypothetical protein